MPKSLEATTQAAAAASIGVNRRTFHDWLSEGCPGENGKYVLSEIVSWARKNKWSSDSDEALLDSIGDEELKAKLVEERVKKLQRENRLADYKIAEKDASLVDVEAIESFLVNEFATRMRSAIETVEKKHGPGSCSPIRKILKRLDDDISGGAIDISGGNRND